MCLLVFGVDAHPEYELILVANRDEFFNRESLKAHLWQDPEIVAGKDQRKGGTWLGIDGRGRLAAVTNFRNPAHSRPTETSRGELPVEYLKSSMPAEDFLKSLSAKAHAYNGFNLLLKDDDDVFHYSNISNQITRVESGIHGLSNALLNSSWPKVNRGKEKLREALAQNMLEEFDLANLLYDEELAPDKDLPQTGVSPELEKQLSAMFIKIPGYGTRCTTVIKIRRDKSIVFTEVIYNDKGKPADTAIFKL